MWETDWKSFSTKLSEEETGGSSYMRKKREKTEPQIRPVCCDFL